jgi:hypothetical protein
MLLCLAITAHHSFAGAHAQQLMCAHMSEAKNFDTLNLLHCQSRDNAMKAQCTWILITCTCARTKHMCTVQPHNKPVMLGADLAGAVEAAGMQSCSRCRSRVVGNLEASPPRFSPCRPLQCPVSVAYALRHVQWEEHSHLGTPC